MATVPSDLLDRMDALLGRRDMSQRQLNDWMAGAATGGPNHDGRFPLTDGSGYTRMVPSPARAQAEGMQRGPEAFGAFGDGQSHPARDQFATIEECREVYPFAISLAQEMDFLAWQAMINTIGDYLCPCTTYKMCNPDPDSQHPLDWVAGRVDVDASHSTLDWQDMRPKSSDVHVFDNYDVHSPDGWQNATIYDPAKAHIKYVTFDQGAAIGVDDYDGVNFPEGSGPYYAFGYPINPAPGRYRVYVEGTITRGVSYDHKNLSPPYGFVNFSSQYGIDQGGWPATYRFLRLDMALDPTDPVGTPAPFSGQFDIEVTPGSPPGHIMFKGGGYMNLRLTRLDMMPYVPNCAILNNRDHAPAHYFMAKRFRNANLLGPHPSTGNWRGLTCALWKSFDSIDGDLQDWEQIRCYGWAIAAELSDGCYLLHFYHCYLLGERCAIYFGAGSVNAGENIKLIGGNASAGEWIIENPGAGEFSLFGVATDYPGKGLCKDNAGLIRLIGTRHEQPIPKGFPIWHCTTGRVIYEASFVLLAGEVGGATTALAQLDTTTSSIEFHSTQLYNLTTKSGVVASGAGRISTYGFLNSGNPNIGFDLLTEADSSDVLGGAGRFKQAYEVGFINNAPGGIYMPGGLFSTAQGRDIMIDRWNSESIRMSVSTDYARTGTHSLKVEKLTGPDNNVASQIQFLVPLSTQGNMLGRMFFLFPNALDPEEYSLVNYPAGPLIYFRQFYVQVIGYDVLGRPILSNRGPFKGEKTIQVPIDGDPEWMKRQLSTLYEPASTEPDRLDKSPAWATHYMVAIDIQSVGAMTFYIDDFQMNFLG